MSTENIKEQARARMELRIYAKETLDALVSWIQAAKPSEWLPVGKDVVVSQEEQKPYWRDYVDRSAKLITKAWRPAELLVDDLTAFMEEICEKPKKEEDRTKGTPESK